MTPRTTQKNSMLSLSMRSCTTARSSNWQPVEERRVRVMEKEEDFNSIRPRAIGLTGILVTHGHWDHIRAIKELDHLTGAVTSAGAADAVAIKEQEDYTVEEELTGGESFDFYRSDTVIRSLHVPGHTPDPLSTPSKPPGKTAPRNPAVHRRHPLPGGVGKTDSPQQFGELFSNVLESSSVASKTTPSYCRPRPLHHPRRRAPPSGRVGNPRLVNRS